MVLFLSLSAAQADLVWESTRERVRGEPDARQINASFRFRNDGDTPVRILGVDTSCSCTSAAPSIRQVAPGQSGTVDAIFDVGSRTGLRAYRIFVRTSEKTNERQELVLEADIPTALKLSPRTLVWPESDRKSPQTVTIRVPAGMVVQTVESSSPLFAARVERGAEADQFLLIVTPQDVSATTRARMVLRTEPPTKNTMAATVLLVVR